MSLARTLATTRRVLMQLRHDHRTMALILLMPSLLIIILRYVFDSNPLMFSGLAPILLGIIPFFMMFIISSVAVLRERTSGTLERLLTSPASRGDILFGYAIAFALLALLQATVASFVVVGLLNVTIAAGTPSLLLVAVMAGVLGMSFGLLASAFARNEFQAVQFMPAFVLPQILIGGLFTPRENMARVLELLSDVLPLTYLIEAMAEVRSKTEWTAELLSSLLIVAGFTILALILGAISLKSK